MSSELSGLDVWVERHINPLPTGFYHLLDARAGEFIAAQLLGQETGRNSLETSDSGPCEPWGERYDPVSFVQVCIKNSSKQTQRLIVRGYLEDFSDEAVETIEIPSKRWAVVEVKPTLKNECVERMEQTRQASMHILLQHMDGTFEGHKTVRVTC
ncbi:MAG: hypothetical protein O3A00_21690, partial [Planctomycetota bacterium]|nr:hypothetical protein [Planctomycetota bacterium]